ncbi:hypothetical protein ACFLZI_01785 [Nitrospirota bacterium]
MTITKRIFMLMATCCLIVLLTASFAMAGEAKATDMPSEEAILKALTSKKNLVKYLGLKDISYAGNYRLKDYDDAYRLFITRAKDGDLINHTFHLYKLNTGKWVIGIYTVSLGNAYLFVE